MKLNINAKKQNITNHSYSVIPLSYCLTVFVLVNTIILPANAFISDRSSKVLTISNSDNNNGTKSTIINKSNYISSVNKDSKKNTVKYITNYKTYSSPNSRYSDNNNQKKLDSMGNLIQQKNREYDRTADAFYKSQTNPYAPSYSNNNTQNYNYNNYNNSYNGSSNYGASLQPNFKFDTWLNQSNHRQQANGYKQYLQQRVGVDSVPPMSQLLLTARSWATCGASPYQVPPRYIWDNIVPTLQLYSELKRQGVLPYDTIIRSVYRNPSLNRCANGANGSKHKVNSAMDLWEPSFDYDIWQKHNVQDRLCQFWINHGESYNFGLGIYSTGAIHIDTEGYRKWGSKYTSRNSPCRS